MNFNDRLADILRRMQDAKLDLIVGLHDGAHFIEKPNPVMVMAGFKALGPAAALLHADGRCDLVVTPAWTRSAPRSLPGSARHRRRRARRGHRSAARRPRPRSEIHRTFRHAFPALGDRRPHHRRAAVHDLSRQACIRRRRRKTDQEDRPMRARRRGSPSSATSG